jgi:hypothetical protein
MKDLIEALTIFMKYLEDENDFSPTGCEHDVLYIMSVGEDEVSQADCMRLDELGFFWNNEYDCWASFRFGSA